MSDTVTGIILLVIMGIVLTSIMIVSFDTGKQYGKLENMNKIDNAMVLENRILIERLIELDLERKGICDDN